MRINEHRHPLLYIQEEDRLVAIKELQKAFSQQIEQSITTGNAVKDISHTFLKTTIHIFQSGKAPLFGVCFTVNLLYAGLQVVVQIS